MADFEKATKGLRHCINAENNGCDGCPYYGKQPDKLGCEVHLHCDVLELLQNRNEKLEKLRVDNARIFERIEQLKKELSKERAYNYALVTIIKSKYPE